MFNFLKRKKAIKSRGLFFCADCEAFTKHVGEPVMRCNECLIENHKAERLLASECEECDCQYSLDFECERCSEEDEDSDEAIDYEDDLDAVVELYTGGEKNNCY